MSSGSELGIVGLGRMGANIARRLMRDGHRFVVYDVKPDPVEELAGEGADGAASLAELASKLSPPRAVWVMVPAGEITEQTVSDVATSSRRATRSSTAATPTTATTSAAPARSPNAGSTTSIAARRAGVFGPERGYCMMIGGPDDAVRRLDPIFATLAPGVDSAPRTPGRDGDPRRPRTAICIAGRRAPGTS